MDDKKNMGFIKIDRNIVYWRWWSNHNTLHVFLTILLMANYKDCDFENTVIHRGQLATSHATLSKLTGLTVSQTRTALSNLKSSGEIAITRKPRYLVITVINYNKYQENRTQIAGKSHADRNQIAIKSQQSKNSKEGKRRKEEEGRFAPESPSGEEHHDYPFPCGLWERPDWLTEEEWERDKYLTANDVLCKTHGDYDNVVEYLKARKAGKV